MPKIPDEIPEGERTTRWHPGGTAVYGSGGSKRYLQHLLTEKPHEMQTVLPEGVRTIRAYPDSEATKIFTLPP